ncbi:hypothetical protein ACFWNK_34035 [Streptomyces sp. NPDC058417]|uniref:hypothetical protein n=1 Tax=unclassified Streptomyces TaxID=2593676 RepID=UPI00364E23DC
MSVSPPSESAAPIERFIIPIPESASPIRLAPFADQPDISKYAVTAMAKSRVITRRERGIYSVPGRENDPDPEDHFPGNAGAEERTSDTLAGGGSVWFAEGGPHVTSEEAQFGYSANGFDPARSAA